MSDSGTVLYPGLYSALTDPLTRVETHAAGHVPRPMLVAANVDAPVVQDASDEALLLALAKGDRDSIALLFRRHAAAVGRVAFRILRDEGEADDLVQEVFLFLFRKASLFDPDRSSGRSWIIQIAYHRAFDRRRRLAVRHHHRTEEIFEDVFRTPGQRDVEQTSVDGIAGRELLTKYRDCLTGEQAETLELFFFAGYDLREISESTGQTLVNVRNHYYRGLSRLRSRLLPKKEQLR